MRLSELARHLILPEGIESTGWPSVCATCDEMGIAFDEWQDGLGKVTLAKRADGLYAADIAAISLSRQGGKTFWAGATIFALSIKTPTLTLWTAHRTRTAAETFRSMQAFAALPKVAPHIADIKHGSGQEAIEFVNGSRILFGARERGFGRGFPNVGILFFDEAQILSEGAMDDMVPSTNTHPNPLIILAGTPPKPTDDGEVFTVLRQEALDGESNDVLFVEVSADADADPLDRAQWLKMNPSFPARTSERAIMRMHKVLSEESFRREAMGIWDPFSRHLPVIKMSDWTPLEGIAVNGVRPDALGVDMNHAREISIAACWIDEDTAHVEEVFADPSAIKAVQFLAKRGSRRMPIVIDRASPAVSLVSELEAARLRVIQTSANDYVRACGLVVDRVDARTLTHGGQQSVDDALAGARKRPIRDAGGWGWDRRDEQVNLAPLVAVTLALFGASTAHRGTRTRTSGRREAVVV